MKKILIFESCPGVPHTDTSLELLIKEKEIGNQVYFGLLFPSNKAWEYSMKDPVSDHKALSGLLVSNIKNLCLDLEIECIFPENSKINGMDEVYSDVIYHGKKFKNKWDLKTVIISSVSGFTHKFEPDFTVEPYKSYSKIYSDVAIQTYHNAINIIDKIKPDLIYFYAGRWASCIPIGWACKDAGIKYLTHERGSNSQKYSIYNYTFLSLEETTREIKKIATVIDRDIVRLIGGHHFYARRNRSVSYWPSYNLNQASEKFPSFLKNVKYVVFFSSSEDEFCQTPGNKVEAYFGKQFEAFEQLKSICRNLCITLVVRVHPNIANKHPEEEAYWAGMADENTIVLGSKSNFDSYTILDHAHCVVTYATSMGLEAAFWGKPSVLLGNSSWYGESGFYCPKNKDQLSDLIVNAVALDVPDFAYMYGYYYETVGYDHKFYKSESFWSGKFLGNNLHPAVI